MKEEGMKINAVSEYKTTCSYCGVGCGIIVRKDRKGTISLTGDPNHPVNRGMLCSKGMNLHYTVLDRSDRLMYPEMRWSKKHPLQRVDWDTAMKRAAAVFSSLIRKYGPDSVGFYISGQCLTEEYYLANKIVKGFIGTNNIDTNSRLCMSSTVVGYTAAFGEDIVPAAYDDIEQADLFLIAGANPAWCHPILFRRIEQHKEKNPDVRMICVDPRKTQTASMADLHLQLRPGTDTVLYHAIGRALIEEGNIDLTFIRNHTDGFDEYRNLVMATTLEDASLICDVEVESIRKAATMIANAKGFLSLWAMGLNQSTDGVNRNSALINLNLITGHIGRPGSGPFSLTGQPNAMGGREAGGMASLLAAHRTLANPAHRDEVARFWGVDTISEKPGLTAVDMFKALRDGKMKAIWIICTNPSVSMPDAQLVDEALSRANFVIVQDISKKSDTLAYADLVLPAAGWLEKEGTMTNSERRISYLNKVIDPPGEARADAEILLHFARDMKWEGFNYKNISEVYDEYCALTKGTNIDISGLSHNRLKANSFQWPVPTTSHAGTSRMFGDNKFFTSNGRAKICAGGNETPSEIPTDEFPLVLTTGRIRDQWHTMTRTGKVSRLNTHISKPFLEIHPDDAAARGIREGDPVRVRNARGTVQVIAKLSETIKKGVVFLPMHWGKLLGEDFSRANNLTNSAYDPGSKQPGLKYTVVEAERFSQEKQKIIIVGAGAAAYRFIMSYRELNQADEIHVFSKEQHPFYNRVLLPEYANDELRWEDLQKFRNEEFAALGVVLHVGTPIERINRINKTVEDAKGGVHSYDKLVLATGSRAFVPPDAPVHLPGVFTMRTREDADRLKTYIKPTNHVLVVGGGLLGLEVAAALRKINIEVSIVQLSSRLMERQLDTFSSTLLREQMELLGIQIFTNDKVQDISVNLGDTITVNLKSGNMMHCHAVVYAVGTRPNIDLATEADLDCGRGVKVNDYLRTSDPSIFAIGEIAEHNQKLNGTTAAAEQQAHCLARYLHGDLTSAYPGTLPVNILKVADLALCSLGSVDVPLNEEGYDEILFIDRSKFYYKKCVIRNDRLVGAILMGDKEEFAEFRELIENKTELSEKRMELLRSGKKAEPVLGRLVCSCGNVGEGNIRKAVSGGATEFHRLCQVTGAGLGCGSCKPEVKAILESSAEPVLA